MENRSKATLEFDKILDMLKACALSPQAKARILALEPMLNESIAAAALRETSDARHMIEAEGQPPLSLMDGLEENVLTAVQGGLLMPEQLLNVAVFAGTCRRMASYLKKCEALRNELSLNGRAFMPLDELIFDIEESIRGDAVADSASGLLRDLRRKISINEEQVKRKLNAILQNHREWFSDSYIAMRGGRFTVPVKAQYRAMVQGAVIDRSQTGGTLFVEPAAARAMHDELALLQMDEENEVRRILYTLTASVADHAEIIKSNISLMARLDFAFAKGKLSLEMDARETPVTQDRLIKIIAGRHPMLDRTSAVPLDFEIGNGGRGGEAIRGVVITGPNTGGKTVALKTIGLLSMMAQSGLHIPAGEGSTLCMRSQVLCDIGDNQSIAENLSTFSSHMTQVLSILKTADKDSLVLLDELGSGTDPAEGMGLAIAILDELAGRGCLFVATTHYPEIKEYAREAGGMINARMTFDLSTLSPLYRMELGEAGESCALHIARMLGFPDQLIERAREAAYRASDRKDPAPVAAPRGNAIREAEPGPRITRFEPPKTASPRALSFGRGDSVRVYPKGHIGIVYAESDSLGMIGVQLRGKKELVPHKRLKRVAAAEMMYPDDYDFSIVFDTVANRKARHVMEKRHDPTAIINI